MINNDERANTVVLATSAMKGEGKTSTVANLGFEQTTFAHPVFIGDTLTAETEVLAVRSSGSRPDAGIVTFEHRMTNQRGESVCVSRRTALMHRRPPDSTG